MKRLIFLSFQLLLLLSLQAQNCDTILFPNGKQFYDTYHEIASDLSQWKHFNTHDPTVYKQGEWYYMYSTDASWAGLNKNGAMKRRSKDLVNWEYLGNAFNGVPQSAVDFFKANGNPNYTDQGIWAPFLFKLKNKYILYYSAPGGLNNINFAYIGYATSDSISGPWEDKGKITSSYKSNINAIDPSVIYDSTTNKLWMSYGSWFSGIYILELDTATGGIKTPGDKGKLIANRKYSYLGQEGSELNYRNGWYYLFLSYDGLGDLYNVRVGRSRAANGPYYDFNGKSMAGYTDNVPMVQAPYKFKNHPGWQGTGHCSVYNDNGKYYMFNQGRPSIVPEMMVLHVREIYWIDDWPVVSPERYAGVPNCPVIKDSLPGSWEYLPLIYHSSVAGGFHSNSKSMQLNSDGTFNDNASNTWTYENDTLILNWSTGSKVKFVVRNGWDWENNCKTILISGIDTKGTCVWGKKINQVQVEKYNSLTTGSTFIVRNALSHLVMNVPGGEDNAGITIRQAFENGQNSQFWKIKDSGDGYSYIFPQHSKKNLCLSIQSGSATNGAVFLLSTFDGSDKQKFQIISNGNGFYRIASKVSNGKSCADDEGFSIAEGARIIQWSYLGGINQQWRFERIDSIARDTISVDTFTNTGVVVKKAPSISVYPNPSCDGRFELDLSSLESSTVILSVTDMNGKIIYNKKTEGISLLNLRIDAPKGIYFLNLNTGKNSFHRKLVIQ